MRQHLRKIADPAPLLDDALCKLGERDRNAIVLRFFENKSLSEIGSALGTSEGAAKVRVNRALEKMRIIFSKRGVTLTGKLIAAAVSANSIQAAPVGLTTTIVATAAKGTAISVTITTLVNGTLKTLTWLKIKLAAGVGLAALVAGGVAVVAIQLHRELRERESYCLEQARDFLNIDGLSHSVRLTDRR